MRVRIHRNMNRGDWTRTEGGRPVTHVASACLTDAEFRVSEAGRQRVLTQRRRAVHAYCVGEEWSGAIDPQVWGSLVEVSYNPYRAGHFYRRDTGAEVKRAALVVFTSCGLCLAQLKED